MLAVPALAYESDSSRVKHPAALHVLKDNTRDAKMADETLHETVAPVMDWTDDKLRSMIGEINGFSGCKCPNCGEFELAFTLEEPQQITCNNCGIVYPNEKFPCDQTVEATNPLGGKVTYAVRVQDGYQYFIPAKVRRERHQALSQVCLAAARLYHRTGEEKYAHLALLIMERFAEVYPGWCVHRDHSWWEKHIIEERPWPYFGGKWHSWFHLDMPIDLIFAYDLIYDSEMLRARQEATFLHPRRSGFQPDTFGVKDKLEDFFRSCYQFVMESKSDHGMTVGNMTPYTCRHFIACGRVIDEPDMIHTAVSWMRRLCETLFFFDGMWHEGALGYHGQATWNLSRAARALKGYTDPEGYVDQKHGLKLQAAEFYADYPFMEEVAQVPYGMLYPDGSLYRVHDTGWTRKYDPPDYLNIEFNAYGHFAIGRGEGDSIIQAHLHFCPLIWVSHYHQDRLNMTLFGAGREMIPDIGYARTKHRYFATSQIGHNLVAVDWTRPPRIPEDTEHSPDTPTRINNYPKSSLLAYDPGVTSDKWVQLIEAEAPNTFCTDLEQYRRALLLIGGDEQRSYLVDIFRVAGGAQHDWLLHGPCDEDMTMQTTARLTPRPGTLAGTDSKYGQIVRSAPAYSWLVDDLRTTDASQGLKFTWTGQDSGAAVATWLLPLSGAEAIFGQCPSYHRAGKSYADVDLYKMPFLDVRRPGDDPQATTFVAVYGVTAKGQEPLIHRVSAMAIDPPDQWTTAISVTCGDRTDVIYSSLDDIPRQVGEHICAGRFVVVSTVAGKTDYVYGWGCKKIVFREGELTVQDVPTCKVLATRRTEDGDEHNGIVVEGNVPELQLEAPWVRVVHGDGTAHGYAIVGSEKLGDDRTLLLTRGDPGFRMTERGIKMARYPHWDIAGPNTLELFNSVFLRLATENGPQLKGIVPAVVEMKLR